MLDELLRGGQAKTIARSLGITPQTVQKWGRLRARLEPTGTGRHHPLDAMQALVVTWVAREGTLDCRQRLAQWVAQQV